MTPLESIDFLVVGCGPAGAAAAREAARGGVATLVLERDRVVGEKRVCAAGLRPGFCNTFDLPKTLIHCDTPRLALFDSGGCEHEIHFGPGHTTTREELDGTMGALAAQAGAHIRTQALFRGIQCERGRHIVEYADLATGARKRVAARHVFFACGATARLEERSFGALAMPRWSRGLMTTLQYRIYLDRPAETIAYRTLELHYYRGECGRAIVGWMFPKRDHLAIGLGVMGKLGGALLREELDLFTERVRTRLYPNAVVASIKREGHLLYGGMPRPHVGEDDVMVGGTAAGFVDATNGEGIFEAAMSGRFAAQAVSDAARSSRPAAQQYASLVRERFARRLAHRVFLMRYLERRPRRFALLFTQLARTPGLAQVLLKEDKERSMSERGFLYVQALRFATRTATCSAGVS